MSESQPGQVSARSPGQADGDTPFALSQEPVTAEGPAPELPAGTVPAPAYEHLGELPASYGTQSVYVVAYDPRQLFVYWDIDWQSAPRTPYKLHVCRADGTLEKRLDISSADTGRYVDVACPGGTYFVELGHYGRDSSWQPVACSSRVTMPPPGLSGDWEPKFATLPFHLSFQRLLELINNAMGPGEDLTAALARLQQGGEPEISPLLSTLHGLTDEQLHTLEMLLGQRFEIASDSSSQGGAPGGVPPVLRDRQEAISSAGFGSEARLAGGSETLSSGAFGSETLASGGLTMGSGSLSSFAAGPSSEAWRMAASRPGGGSDTMDSERAAVFLQAVEKNLGVLSSIFSDFGSPGGSDGFSAGGW